LAVKEVPVVAPIAVVSEGEPIPVVVVVVETPPAGSLVAVPDVEVEPVDVTASVPVPVEAKELPVGNVVFMLVGEYDGPVLVWEPDEPEPLILILNVVLIIV
jgi:hypothetical protein